MYPLLTLILPTTQIYDLFWFPLLLAPKFYHQGSIFFLQWTALQPGREQTWPPSSLKELLMSFRIVDVLDEFFSFPNLSYLLFCRPCLLIENPRWYGAKEEGQRQNPRDLWEGNRVNVKWENLSHQRNWDLESYKSSNSWRSQRKWAQPQKAEWEVVTAQLTAQR